uniref:Farnesoic acid O-methyl transferase domain-containing protein n=1 Tax=Anopheles culicifacies TaxID=139723 RepID=A0A182LUC2_9DIPT
MVLSAVVIVLIVQGLAVDAFHRNSFDVVRGCKQHDSIVAYDAALAYFPTSSLLHVGHTHSSKYFNVAILGPNDGIIRYGESLFPYDKDVIEIVLGGWGNTKSAGRLHHRTGANNYDNNQLVEAKTPNLLSNFRPTMFVVEMFNNGTVQVRIEGQDHPFLSFNDSKRIPFNYMEFTKWDKDVIFFYDCPLDHGNAMYNHLSLNCTVV